ncbi:MAG: T9SS type A sorting domain-containing protein, partial [Prolixibacteraceae bacterium]|nr:T9SS type A sorting domain-containing protein [Prolixibacteraceae bacterium]
VYNISGCLIKTGELTKNKSTLDMTNVEKGTYLVMVSGETIRLSQKIIIN